MSEEIFLTVTRRIEFDAAHRVLKHESKCRNLHGHRYVAEITVNAPQLDPLDRVVDFGVLKELIGRWVDENWDHNILLNSEDPLVLAWVLPHTLLSHVHNIKAGNIFDGKAPYIFTNQNPTAEAIAAELFEQCCRLLPAPLVVTQVRIYETPNCWADAYVQ